MIRADRGESIRVAQQPRDAVAPRVSVDATGAGAPLLQGRYPGWLEGDLRSDHAGETGAVAIYRGILAVTRSAALREFARRHLQTESRHLETINSLFPAQRRSRLVPLWTIAGFITGAAPAVFGENAVYATVEAVETFVDHHYREQIEKLENEAAWAGLKDTLESLRQDEIAHRDEARRAQSRESGAALRLWLWAVSNGSQLAVAIARRF